MHTINGLRLSRGGSAGPYENMCSYGFWIWFHPVPARLCGDREW